MYMFKYSKKPGKLYLDVTVDEPSVFLRQQTIVIGNKKLCFSYIKISPKHFWLRNRYTFHRL